MDELAGKLKGIIAQGAEHRDYDMSKYDWDRIAEEVFATLYVAGKCIALRCEVCGNFVAGKRYRLRC